MTENYRPNKDEYYWNIAKETAQRSTCMSVKGGAIIVRDDQIIATGYIGAPRETKDCFERGTCVRRVLNIPSGQRYEICRSTHAEQNAVINAARAGVSLLGGTVYLYFVKRSEDNFVNAYPCFMCKILNFSFVDNMSKSFLYLPESRARIVYLFFSLECIIEFFPLASISFTPILNNTAKNKENLLTRNI